jgi:hypothetical protein
VETGEERAINKIHQGSQMNHKNVRITVKLEGNRVFEEFDSNIGLKQGCSLPPVLFPYLLMKCWAD